jgi:hypothetical protein
VITRKDLEDVRELMQDDLICVLDGLGARSPGCVAVMLTADEAEEMVAMACQVVVDRVEELLKRV